MTEKEKCVKCLEYVLTRVDSLCIGGPDFGEEVCRAIDDLTFAIKHDRLYSEYVSARSATHEDEGA